MDAGSRRWWPALVALTTLVLAESIRVLLPLLYDVREDRGAGVAVGWALAVFLLAPVVAWPVRAALGAPRALRMTVAILATARIAMQLVDPIPLVLAAVAVAAALVSLALVVDLGRRAASGAILAAAVLAGLTVDTALRGAFVGWDPVWQEGVWPVVVAAGLGVALLVGAFRSDLPVPSDGDGATWTVALFGPFLVLEILFLQNPGFAGSETGLDSSGALVVLLVGDACALAAAAATAAVPTAPRRSVAAVAVGAATVAIAHLDGAAVGLAIVVASGGAGALLVCVLATRSPAAVPARRGDLALALGFGLFVGIVFAYQIDIDSPLPVPRATWPIVAAVLLASAATREVRSATLPRLLAAAPLVALFVPLGLALTAPSLEVRGVGNGSYRLLDWNLHTGVNGDGQIDLETIARLIDDRDPDIVVLQEVGRGWPIAGANDQAEWLSRRLGMRYEWAPAADDQFGNLILSRFTMSDAEILRLPYGEGPQHRSALRVLVGTGPGAPVQVIGVHLQNGDVPATREDQIEAVLAAWPHDPGTVIAGDLNMQPTESNVTLFVDAGFASAQDDATIGDPDGSTARDPLFVGDRVDWIWVTPDVPYDTFAIVESEASDHLPLVVTAPEPRVAET